MNERDFPYHVELPVPPNGFGHVLDEIHLFHDQIGEPARGGGRRRSNDKEYVRWCFADPQHARSFQALFGGTILEPG